WVTPAVFAAITVVSLIAGSLTAGFNRQHARPDSVLYGFDADANKAVWASADESVDSWTQQFFNGGANRATLAGYMPLSSRTFLQAPAPVAQLSAPKVDLLQD